MASTGSNEVYRYYAPNFTTSGQVAASVIGAEGVDIDSSGDIYVTAYGGSTVTKITPVGYSFGTATIGGTVTSANKATLNFAIASGTTVGSIGILTQGAAGKDFTATSSDTSTTLCTAKTYTSATVCTVDVTFWPLRPGARNGAVVLYNGSGAVIATGYLSGTGTGPVVTYAPYTQSTLTSAITNPEGMAVDGSGNLFVAAGSAVYELAYSNGAFGAPVSILSTYGGTLRRLGHADRLQPGQPARHGHRPDRQSLLQ